MQVARETVMEGVSVTALAAVSVTALAVTLGLLTETRWTWKPKTHADSITFFTFENVKNPWDRIKKTTCENRVPSAGRLGFEMLPFLDFWPHGGQFEL